jgi:predicted nucleic acid-binding protein
VSVVVDTSVWIDYFRGKGASELDELLREGLVILVPVVAAELLSAPLTRRERREVTELFLALPLQPTPLTHWCAVGELRAQLLKVGVRVSTPDAHVAQCALDAQAALWSRDSIFRTMARSVPLHLFSAAD